MSKLYKIIGVVGTTLALAACGGSDSDSFDASSTKNETGYITVTEGDIKQIVNSYGLPSVTKDAQIGKVIVNEYGQLFYSAEEVVLNLNEDEEFKKDNFKMNFDKNAHKTIVDYDVTIMPKIEKPSTSGKPVLQVVVALDGVNTKNFVQPIDVGVVGGQPYALYVDPLNWVKPEFDDPAQEGAHEAQVKVDIDSQNEEIKSKLKDGYQVVVIHLDDESAVRELGNYFKQDNLKFTFHNPTGSQIEFKVDSWDEINDLVEGNKKIEGSFTVKNQPGGEGGVINTEITRFEIGFSDTSVGPLFIGEPQTVFENIDRDGSQVKFKILDNNVISTPSSEGYQLILKDDTGVEVGSLLNIGDNIELEVGFIMLEESGLFYQMKGSDIDGTESLSSAFSLLIKDEQERESDALSFYISVAEILINSEMCASPANEGMTLIGVRKGGVAYDDIDSIQTQRFAVKNNGLSSAGDIMPTEFAFRFRDDRGEGTASRFKINKQNDFQINLGSGVLRQDAPSIIKYDTDAEGRSYYEVSMVFEPTKNRETLTNANFKIYDMTCGTGREVASVNFELDIENNRAESLFDVKQSHMFDVEYNEQTVMEIANMNSKFVKVEAGKPQYRGGVLAFVTNSVIVERDGVSFGEVKFENVGSVGSGEGRITFTPWKRNDELEGELEFEVQLKEINIPIAVTNPATYEGSLTRTVNFILTPAIGNKDEISIYVDTMKEYSDPNQTGSGVKLYPFVNLEDAFTEISNMGSVRHNGEIKINICGTVNPINLGSLQLNGPLIPTNLIINGYDINNEAEFGWCSNTDEKITQWEMSDVSFDDVTSFYIRQKLEINNIDFNISASETTPTKNSLITVDNNTLDNVELTVNNVNIITSNLKDVDLIKIKRSENPETFSYKAINLSNISVNEAVSDENDQSSTRILVATMPSITGAEININNVSASNIGSLLTSERGEAAGNGHAVNIDVRDVSINGVSGEAIAVETFTGAVNSTLTIKDVEIIENINDEGTNNSGTGISIKKNQLPGVIPAISGFVLDIENLHIQLQKPIRVDVDGEFTLGMIGNNKIVGASEGSETPVVINIDGTNNFASIENIYIERGSLNSPIFDVADFIEINAKDTSNSTIEVNNIGLNSDNIMLSVNEPIVVRLGGDHNTLKIKVDGVVMGEEYKVDASDAGRALLKVDNASDVEIDGLVIEFDNNDLSGGTLSNGSFNLMNMNIDNRPFTGATTQINIGADNVYRSLTLGYLNHEFDDMVDLICAGDASIPCITPEERFNIFNMRVNDLSTPYFMEADWWNH